MIKKSRGAPPPRRPGAAVRASPAPRRAHSNSLRSRPPPPPRIRPARGEGRRPPPLRCLPLRPRVPSPSVRLPAPRAPRAVFVRRSSPAGPPLRAAPLASAAAGLAPGDGPRAEFGETGSEAREPHERAAVRARLRRPRGGAPGGGPLSRARGPEDAGAGAGEGAGPWGPGRRADRWGVSASGDPRARRAALGDGSRLRTDRMAGA